MLSSRHHSMLDKQIVRLLESPSYIQQRHQAWLKCLELMDRKNSSSEHEYPSVRFRSEAELIREAELERDRRRAIQHAERLAEATRKPVRRETGSQLRRIS